MEILRDVVSPATWVGALFYGAVFLVGSLLVARVIRRAVGVVLAKDEEVRIDRTTAHFSVRFAQAAVFLLALLIYAHLIPALRSLGTALLASAGILTVVVGLAAQGTLGNLIAGITILLYRPFKVGDIVQLQTPSGLETGTLERISLGYTIVRAYDGRRIVVPNTIMAGQITANLASSDLLTVVDFHLAYGTDIEKARMLALAVAEAHPSVAAVNGCPLTALGDEGMVLSLRAVCDPPASTYQTRFDLLEATKEKFDEAGIDIAHAATTIELRDVRSE
jgi:small conductance mechanosensitive channel